MKRTAGKYFKTICKINSNVSKGRKTHLTDSDVLWLQDNFYIIRQEYENIKNVKIKGKNDILAFEKIYDWAESLTKAENFTIPSLSFLTSRLTMAHENKPIKIKEFSYLSAALRLALLKGAASLYNKKSENPIMENIIKTFLLLRELNINEIFESISTVDAILLNDKTFPEMTDESKLLYREKVSHFATLSGKDEIEVANCALNLAKDKDGAKGEAGYYLIGNGQDDLRKRLGIKTKRKPNLLFFYLLSLAFSSLILSLAFPTWNIIYFVLYLFVFFDISLQTVQYFLLKTTMPKILPRLRIENGIPVKTIIVYPTLLSSPKKAKEMTEKLEISYLANKEENLSFLILGDFKDCSTLHENPEILTTLKDGIYALNQKYGNHFYGLMRNLTFSPLQKKWMGKERKRGALESLNDYSRSEFEFPYKFGETDNLKCAEYIYTVDDDTLLPPGSVRKIIGTALHPLNKPEVKNGKIISGYGILQPRVSIGLESGNKTFFSKIMSGPSGVDTYQTPSSELYMDIFGETIFTGKGLYHIDSFREFAKFPDNTVLSHDILEGSCLRCGLVSDVQVFDGCPQNFREHIMRQERWIRGDWQNIRWLFRKKNESPRISALSKWGIFDNLRRSLKPVVQVVLLFSGKTELITLSLFSLFLPVIFTAFESLIRKSFLFLNEKRYSPILYGLKNSIYMCSSEIILLGQTAYIALCGAIRGLYRTFTHRKTLEWTPAAELGRNTDNTICSYFLFMSPSVLLGLILLMANIVLLHDALGPGIFLSLLWITSPFFVKITGTERNNEEIRITKKNKEFLYDNAKRIWAFFDKYMCEEDHFLPPDNVQKTPSRGVTHRTSPTNIGFGFLSPLCAYELKLISLEDFENRIENILKTVESLPKWNGHLYNWYETNTLNPLFPRFISTVDSGNFISYIITVAEAIKNIRNEETTLYKRLMKLVYETDFRPLYNKKKKLFSVGFSLDENQYTNACYDYLASEARQASFLSIALSQIEPEHWFRLGRGLVESGGYKGLISWSGTMFEYFMPRLIMKNFDNSVLSETYKFVLRCQKDFARKRGTPYGVSESGFYEFDNNDNYQYKAFGIPKLSLARHNADDVVITPYAAFLSLCENPNEEIANLNKMKKEGLYGEFGFYEAVDYSKTRLNGTMRRGIVRSYMAHHQGMSLAAITNLLCNNILQKRFHSFPPVKSAEILLKERVYINAPVIKGRDIPHIKLRPERHKPFEIIKVFENENTFPPSVRLLSNGNYHIHIDTNGHGESKLGSIRLNHFSSHHGGGQYIWILNPTTGELTNVYEGKAVFSNNKAEFIKNTPSFSSHVTVTVSKEDNFERRRLTIVNQSKCERSYEVYFYTPLSLATETAESAHPVFSKLFITTKERNNILYATRRKRADNEEIHTAFATVETEDNQNASIQYDTDRLSFWGRCNGYPASIYPKSILNAKTGTVLDPCFAFKVNLTVDASKSTSVTFISGLAENEEHIDKMRISGWSDKQTESASDIILNKKDDELFNSAAAFLLYGGYNHPLKKDAMNTNRKKMQEIWKFGISGDNPIVTLNLKAPNEEKTLNTILKAQSFWKNHGIKVDLVVCCDEPRGYHMPLYEMAAKKKRKGVYIIRRSDITESDKSLLLAVSSLYLDGEEPFKYLNEKQTVLPEHKPNVSNADTPLPHEELLYFNEFGGFDSSTYEYVINQKNAGSTPLPWSHIVANKTFGFLVTESGGGYTWFKNSQKGRISPWSNDPVTDPVSEFLKIREKDDVWSPMAGVYKEKGDYRVKYGFGYATFERITRDIYHKVTMFVPTQTNEKVIIVELQNRSKNKRNLLLSYGFYPVLAAKENQSIIIKEEKGKLLFSNPLHSTNMNVYLSTDRECKFSFEGQKASAIVNITLNESENGRLVFRLGVGENKATTPEEELYNVKAYWKNILSAVKVKTKNEAVNIMLNCWLPYQAIACRLFARTSFYQSGGAVGFRDQLQDALSAIDSAPNLVKEQIILHASHQFEEGDVFHWWHNDETGVRTKISDDRLFLPYIAMIYADETGDKTIWDEKAPFISEPILGNGESERYTYVKNHTKPYSIYEHCKRAILISLQKGEHALSLMGGGDWNDGMNKVGIEGKGESVWLSWFLKCILEKFYVIAENRNDTETAKLCKRESAMLSEAIETNAWTGEYYLRGFFDDGTVLGSPDSSECKIDAICQAWSVIGGGARKTRQKAAMDSVYKTLTNREIGIIKLLAPPFSDFSPNPGYIQSYPKGIRENGGQYTHAAVWVAMAFAMLEDKEKAWELFKMLLPINHSKTKSEACLYKAEPYVMCADIYTAEGHEGRGGWSWYTGAAAWIYRTGIRYILGFKRNGNCVRFEPMFPMDEDGFEFVFRYKSTTYNFKVYGKSGDIELTDDGKTHEIIIKGDAK